MLDKELQKLLDAYNLVVKGIDNQAQNEEDRAYGGIVRAGKGLLVESLAKETIKIAWKSIGGQANRLGFDKHVVRIPLRPEYLKRVESNEIRMWIKRHIDKFYYDLKSDVHVLIDEKLVIAVECKAYTENAMMKRILVDFMLMKTILRDLKCALFQLESQLGGDYSLPNKKIIYGSFPTHTLMSYFDLDLMVVTLLEGERKVYKAIHKKEFFKELKRENLIRTVKFFENQLHEFV